MSISPLQVCLPPMGEGVTEARLNSWCKKPGEWVTKEEILVEVSTDKLDAEIPAPFAGHLVQIISQPGESVQIGQPIALLSPELPTSLPSSSPSLSPSPEPEKALTNKTTPSAYVRSKAADAGGSSWGSASSPPSTSTHHPSTPETSKPTHSSSETSTCEPTAHRTVGSDHTGHQQKPYFSPYVRYKARELGISLTKLADLQGSGRNGRLTAADLCSLTSLTSETQVSSEVSCHTGTHRGTLSETRSETLSSPPLLSSTAAVPLSSLRKAISRSVAHSYALAPHASVSSEIPLTVIKNLRSSSSCASTPSTPPHSFSVYILYALAKVLKRHPLMRASIKENHKVQWHQDTHIGCAVALDGAPGESGVLIPVIRHCDTLSLSEISDRLRDLVERARHRTLRLDETSGGTFTFTNPGMFGCERSSAIIQQPEVAILSMGSIKHRYEPVFDDGTPPTDDLIEAQAITHWRRILYADFTLTFDHRLIDGKEGAVFLSDFARILSHPGNFVVPH